MLALDLDGTTLAPDGRTVPPRTRRALDAARSAGWLVTFATGRSYTESRRVMDAAGHEGPGVFANGALVSHHPTGETIIRGHMPPTIAAAVCRHVLVHNIPPAALQDPTSTGGDYLVPSTPTMDPARTAWWASMGAVVADTPDLTDPAVHEHTLRINALGQHAQMAAFVANLRQELGDQIYLHQITVRDLGTTLVEIFANGVSKWGGIQHIADQADIRGEQIVAVGDDHNDRHMIEHAGLGVAMGDAPPEIKQLAKRTIGTNEEEALAGLIEELVSGP